VDSAPGRGTTFRVYFPRVDGPAAPLAATSRGEVPGGTETILLVEDEASVRRMTRQVLESAGYRVLEAAHGDDGLRLGREYAGRIDLLLTDVVMPGMSGRRLAESLAAVRPETKVLYAWCYTDDEIVQRGVFAQGTDFMPKPFTPSMLCRRVRELLDAPRRLAGG
jgi:response regulator RpfG family c-di-GMP phosphodiesterase